MIVSSRWFQKFHELHTIHHVNSDYFSVMIVSSRWFQKFHENFDDIIHVTVKIS